MDNVSHSVALTQRLIRCPSVTPADAGALDVLAAELVPLGFECTRLAFGEGDARIDNLFAWLGDKNTSGSGTKHFCFAGHTDVVPAGDADAWQFDPFSGSLADGNIYGRGASDMKGGIAAFVGAVARLLESGIFDKAKGHVISLMITGDEEGDAVNGTVKMVEWVQEHSLVPDLCVVGEPTNPDMVGDVIKNGRRGSLSCQLTVEGAQGHVAYPHLADNPFARLLDMLAPVNSSALDGGNAHFDPSTANITSIDTNNLAGNVIPAKVQARFNIRFNTEHTADSLIGWLEEHFERVGGIWHADWRASAHPFLTEPGMLTDIMSAAISKVTGRDPQLSTSGGTSDARFITSICPVAEFGLVGRTMHKIDEHAAIADIDILSAIYENMLASYFEAA